MEQDPVAADSETPTRVDDLWFPKDTIVIRAENKIFQVSRAVLAARSTVFRDMIAFPQPTTENTEQIDGSPVVRLYDPARDVEVFLRAIYDSSYFEPAPAPIELWVVLAILRLAHKYDIQYLYRRALHHLAEDGCYVATYDAVGANHLIGSGSDLMDNFSIIATATEVGAAWVLPWTYYCASGFLPEELVPFFGGEMEQHVRKCLAAHRDLLRATIAINRFLTMSTPAPCTTPPICDATRASNLSLLFELDAVDRGSDLSPLGYWGSDIWKVFKVAGLCDVCCQLAKAQHREAASAFWDKLPSIFGLPPWEDLGAMKRAAMGEDEDENIED
ncbi:hypothetical protein C8R44DRAFT_659613 [Mycena epipterygia]|nr:hypothetical protein C8R44DRAFT_659613 [Mycena epipterygia]